MLELSKNTEAYVAIRRGFCEAKRRECAFFRDPNRGLRDLDVNGWAHARSQNDRSEVNAFGGRRL